MRSYLKYIFISLFTCLLAVSCIEEMESPKPMTPGDALTLVPRVKSFTNKYVTKAYDSSIGEDKIKHLAYIIFDSAGNCVDMAESDVSSTTSLTINKTKLNSSETSATVVLFANVKLDDIKKENTDESGKPNGTFTVLSNQITLSGIDEYSIHFKTAPVVLSSELSSFDGFPMKGVATGVNLTTASNADVEVSLQILYAKISFDIDVAEGTENQNLTENGPSFSLSSYSVHNVSQRTPVTIAEGEATPSTAYAYKATGKSGSGTNNEFTFYMAESRYTPKSTEGGKIDLTGIYPNGWTTQVAAEDVKGYTEGMENQLNGVKYFYDDLIQQYKPKLAEGTNGTPSNASPGEGEKAEGLAAYVVVNGTYVDYRGTSWDVNYKIYLGKDNAQDFHVDRNSEYKNYLTIKGIRNNDSYTDAGSVWIDHRVDVELGNNQGADDCVTITRETLIDSHIEVRPLRVKWSGDTYAGVRVYLPTESNGSLVNWIGIERYVKGKNCLDSSTYCYVNGTAIGKRKYFTTTLISELQTKSGDFGISKLEDGSKFVYLGNGDCAWIYFDEHVSFKDDGTPADARDATIKLEFIDVDGNAIVTEKYKVIQQGLQRRGDFDVESYEEYLHTYDSEDKYNLSTTPRDYTQQGFEWGLSDKVISEGTIASSSSLQYTTGNTTIDLAQYINSIPGIKDLKYDYYHDGDGSCYRYVQDDDGDWISSSGTEQHSGLSFTDRATEATKTTIKDMGSVPQNAYQYCLSKNKFEVDAAGNVKMVLKWYLPDVHELNSVLIATSNNTADFKADDFYWSSQPSFDDSYTYDVPLTNYTIGLITEDRTSARAVSKNVANNGKTVPQDKPRTDKHRIRCLYSAESTTEANMAGRIPEGIGGRHEFIMKGHDAGNYFNYMISELSAVPAPADPNDHDYRYSNSTYSWPTFNNPGSDFGFFNNAVNSAGTTISGFSQNPASSSSWEPYEEPLSNKIYYYTLYDFEGLTTYETEKATAVKARRPTDKYKEDTNVETTKKLYQLDKNLDYSNSDLVLNSLDPNGMLNISFSSNGNTNKPHYIYSAYSEDSKRVTTTRRWNVPTYNKVSLDPSNPFSVTETFTDKATKQYSLGNILSATSQAESEALAAAKNKAKAKYPNAIYAYGTPSYSDRTYRDGWKYYVEVTCTISITSSNFYYENATNGGWYEYGTPKTEILANLEADELRVYSGNTFTISLSDKNNEEGIPYKDIYEITKVKIYYSEDEYITSQDKTYLYVVNIPVLRYYARFIDSDIPLPTPGDYHPEGMEYYNEDALGNNYHQWSGEGRTSITLKLADYLIDYSAIDFTDALRNMDLDKIDFNNFLAPFPYVFNYNEGTKMPSKYLVVNKIEVKCTKKATAASE